MDFIKVKQPPSFKAHAYGEIKKGIIQHEVKPGSMLNERSLSESLGISRTPLKSALQQLEIEGWIQSLPRKGIFVQTINRQDVDDVFQLRKANETLAIELLIPLLDKQTINRIEEVGGQLSASKEDALLFLYQDSSFHLLLAELSQNRRLFTLMQNLTDHIDWYRFAALRAGQSLDEASNEHSLIVEGLREGNTEQTKHAVLSHIDNIYHTIIKNLEE